MATFDRLMIEVEIGSNLKIGRLTDPQFRTLVCGIWPLAAKATLRGYLVVAGTPATAEDVAHQAHCSVSVAAATLEVCRRLNMIELDQDLGFEFCHDWWLINPNPKKDAGAAARKREQRARDAARDSVVTDEMSRRDIGVTSGVTVTNVTGAEVEVEEEEKVTQKRDMAVAARQEEQTVFDAWVQATGRTDGTTLDDKRRQIIRRAITAMTKAKVPNPLLDVVDAALGVAHSEHHMSNRQWNELKVILRDVAQIENFRDLQRGLLNRPAPIRVSDFVDLMPGNRQLNGTS